MSQPIFEWANCHWVAYFRGAKKCCKIMIEINRNKVPVTNYNAALAI